MPTTEEKLLQMLKLQIEKSMKLLNQKDKHQNLNYPLHSLKTQTESLKLFFLIIKLKILSF